MGYFSPLGLPLPHTPEGEHCGDGGTKETSTLKELPEQTGQVRGMGSPSLLSGGSEYCTRPVLSPQEGGEGTS